jgi:hypothetical protein
MRLLLFAIVTLAAACRLKPVDQSIRIVWLDFTLADEQGKRSRDGHVFAIVRARQMTTVKRGGEPQTPGVEP